MKRIISQLTFLILTITLFGQQIPDFKLIDSPGQLKIADSQITDAQGWTHFYNSVNKHLLLSVHAGAADIGSIEDGLTITSGLLGTYGIEGQNLSTADYVEDGHQWFVMNRYFRIEHGPAIDTTLRLRFYFTQKDIDDIARSPAGKDKKLSKREDLDFFTITGVSTHPFTENIAKNGGDFTLYYPPGGAAPTCNFGLFSGWKYVEMEINSLRISGGGGKYIKPFDGRFSATGFVRTQSGKALKDVEILNKDNNQVLAITDANGFYEIENLAKGASYTISPRLKKQGDKGVTVLDMAYLQRGLKKNKLLSDPWMQIAADANYSNYLTDSDLIKMRDAILHSDTLFTGLGGWQFVTRGFKFPAYGDPFKANMPKAHLIKNVSENIKNLDFTAIKTGDLVKASDFPNKPPIDINPTFALEDAVSCGTGDTVTVSLTVNEFYRVKGFQFSLSWDKDMMRFIDVTDFNLSGLDDNSFGFRYRNEGKLAVAWTSIAQRGTSTKDNTVICNLKFLVNGSNGDFTRIEFSDFPAPIEILRDNFSSANTFLTTGSVAVDNKSPLHITNIQADNISCFGEKDGALSFAVKGGSGNYGYKWNNGSTAPSLKNLAGGTYNVTIYDTENCPYVSEDFVINEPEKLRMAGSQVFPISCPGANDGRIETRVIGGTAPYTFKWSHGVNSQNLNKLAPGKYNLTISDAQGCEDYASFTIDNPGQVLLGLSLSHETNSGANNGAIRINKVIGGTEPFEYEWSNGNKTSEINELPAGNYSLTIFDAEACQNKLNFDIKNLNGEQSTSFVVDVQAETVKHGKAAYLKIQSPADQLVGFKMFDMRSQQISNESLALLRGENIHYFTAPNEKGTYLLQILPRTGGIQSIRVSVE